MSMPRIIELKEYETRTLPRQALSQELARRLQTEYGDQVEIEVPSFQNDDTWQLASRGWVGYIPLSDDLHLFLSPKVKLHNLFRMLEYAYDLQSFHLLDDLMDCQSLNEFYTELATVLARRVLDRARRGVYRAYVPRTERLPFVRGQLDLAALAQKPWDPALRCNYQEHTVDIEDNQILAWTLSVIARGGRCEPRALPTIRQAYRALQGVTTLRPFRPEACIDRLYNRLNDNYQPMHALCRFFLEQTGPTHKQGDRTMLPFLVNMALLYERFVARWLQAHLPDRYRLRLQENVRLEDTDLRVKIDLVLYSREQEAPLCVMDTKYKLPDKKSLSDLHQIVSYATAKDCQEALLIYPAEQDLPLNTFWGSHVRVRSATFAVGGDLDSAGRAFMKEVLESLRVPGPS
jgi:5-methylcytosine-specific restriction enzyme subunit McrC